MDTPTPSLHHSWDLEFVRRAGRDEAVEPIVELVHVVGGLDGALHLWKDVTEPPTKQTQQCLLADLQPSFPFALPLSVPLSLRS